MSDQTRAGGSTGVIDGRGALSPNVPGCPNGADGRFSPAAQVPAGLSDAQLKALELLLTGTPQGRAAKACGVDRRTLYRWRTESEPFRAEMERGRRAMWVGTVDRMRGMIETSLSVLEEELHDEYDRSRVRAATIVLTHSGVRKLMEADRAESEG